MSALVCLPGLGADDALFGPQAEAFSNVVVPAWPDPAGVRTVEGLASALLTSLRAQGDWSAGMTVVAFSFGGQVALSMTRLAIEREAPLPKALILVSSPRSREQITSAFRTQVALSRFIPSGLLAWAARTIVAPGFAKACALDEEQTQELRAMAKRLDAPRFKQLARLASTWDFDEEGERSVLDAGVKIKHLHSIQDPVIPAPPRETVGLELLPEKAHLLTWTHADRINALVRGA